jgi:hypothetical protein
VPARVTLDGADQDGLGRRDDNDEARVTGSFLARLRWPSPEKRAYMSLAVTGAAAGEGLRRAQCDLFLKAETSRPTWEHAERAPR